MKGVIQLLLWITVLLVSASAAAQPVAEARPHPAAPAPYEPPSEPLPDERDPITAPRITLAANLTGVGHVDTHAEIDGRSVLEERHQGTLGWGGAAWFDYPLLPFVSLGAGAGLLSWTTEEEDQSGFDRSLLVTVSAHASLRAPLSEMFEVYLRFPVGLSLDLAPEDWVSRGALSPLPGWHAGAALGTFVGGTRFGITFEVGVLVHGLRSTIESDDSTSTGTFERRALSAPLTLGLVWLL